MIIKLIKAFFNPELHKDFIQKHLRDKISFYHPDFVLLENGFTEFEGIYSLWYNFPIEGGQMTSNIKNFVSVKGLLFKMKCFWRKAWKNLNK